MSSNESISYLMFKLLKEPMPEIDSEPKELWLDRTKNSKKYKVGGVNDKPPKIAIQANMSPSSIRSTYRLLQYTRKI